MRQKFIKICLIIIAIELIILGAWEIGIRMFMPTYIMDDPEATAYIASLSPEEREAYITKLPDFEGGRLIELWIAYKTAEAIERDSFEKENPVINEITDGTRYELSNGKGYVIMTEDGVTVFDNDDNEIDPKTIVNEDGIIEMNLFDQEE